MMKLENDKKPMEKKIAFPEKKAQPLPMDRKVNAMKALAANPTQGVVQGQSVKPVVNDMKKMGMQAGSMAKKPMLANNSASNLA